MITYYVTCGIFVVLFRFIWGLVVQSRNEKRISGQHVVITGGSKGIGLHCGVECVKRGANVTVLARGEEDLKAAVSFLNVSRLSAAQKINYAVMDVSKDYETVAKGLADIERDYGDINVLINCAGFAICGVFEEIPVDDCRRMMDVNYYGTYNCTRYVLPKMKAAQEGVIVITSSQAALLGIYGYAPYSATKFALRGLAEAIAMESQHLGVSVTLALPPDTETPGFEEEQKTKPEETKLISGSAGFAKPENVAKNIVADALRGEFTSVYGAESLIVTILGGSMFPWNGLVRNFLHALLVGPLRVVIYVLHWNFGRIIRNCALKKVK